MHDGYLGTTENVRILKLKWLCATTYTQQLGLVGLLELKCAIVKPTTFIRYETKAGKERKNSQF